MTTQTTNPNSKKTKTGSAKAKREKPDRFAIADAVLGGTMGSSLKGRPANGAVGKTHAPKIIRETFSMPEEEYDSIILIQETCMSFRISPNKSEVVRAGLLVLSGMNPAQLQKAISTVRRVRPGRKIGA